MIKCELTEENNEISVAFEQDPVWNERIRQIEGRRWSRSLRCWLVPNTRANVVKIGQLFGKENCRFDEEIIRLYKPQATVEEINQYLNPPRKRWTNRPESTEYDTCVEVIALSQEIKLRNYSHKTFKNYKSALVSLMIHVKKKPLDTLTLAELKSFFLYLIEKRKLSGSSLNVYINAIKFYYENILGRSKVYFDIPMPKKERKMPQVLSVDEVKRLMDATRTPKFKAIFQVLYASGIRLHEVTMLKTSDIDFDRMTIRVEQGKGKKDRYVMLSPKLVQILKTQIATNTGKYVFSNQDTQEPISDRVIQKIFKYALEYAKITKKVGVHVLRHSFATHLLERGENILVIKELLGHSDINTTLKYLHISKDTINKAKSPIDDIL